MKILAVNPGSTSTKIADNCSTRNEFVEKAIRFYSGYLDTEHANEYLPRVLADVLEGKLGALGNRMGR